MHHLFDEFFKNRLIFHQNKNNLRTIQNIFFSRGFFLLQICFKKNCVTNLIVSVYTSFYLYEIFTHFHLLFITDAVLTKVIYSRFHIKGTWSGHICITFWIDKVENNILIFSERIFFYIQLHFHLWLNISQITPAICTLEYT